MLLVRVGGVNVGCVGVMPEHTDPQSRCLSIEGRKTLGRVAVATQTLRFARAVWLVLLRRLGVPRVAALAQGVSCSGHLQAGQESSQRAAL